MFRIVSAWGFGFRKCWRIILSQLINGQFFKNSRTFKSTKLDSINYVQGLDICLQWCALRRFLPELLPFILFNFQFLILIPFRVSFSSSSNNTHLRFRKQYRMRKVRGQANYKHFDYIQLTDSQGLSEMRKYSPKPASDHPIFLVDDDSQDSRPPCEACTRYE